MKFQNTTCFKTWGAKQSSEYGLLGRSVKLSDHGRIVYPKGKYN